MAAYEGSVTLISGITQKNGQDFPLVDASAVNVNLPQDFENDRLDDVLKELKDGQTEQAQADWEQTDSTKPDYIKNKPGSPSGETDPVFLANRNILTVADASGGHAGPYIAPWLFPIKYWYNDERGEPTLSNVVSSNDELNIYSYSDPEFGDIWMIDGTDENNAFVASRDARSPGLFKFDAVSTGDDTPSPRPMIFAYGTDDEHEAVVGEPCVLMPGQPYLPRDLFPMRMYFGPTTSAESVTITARDKYTVEDGDGADFSGAWVFVGYVGGEANAFIGAYKDTGRYCRVASGRDLDTVIAYGTTSQRYASSSDTIIATDGSSRLALSQTTSVYAANAVQVSGTAYSLPQFDTSAILASSGVYRFDVHVSIPSTATSVSYPSGWEWIQGRGIPSNSAELAGKTVRLGCWYDCVSGIVTVGIMDRDVKSAVVKNGGTQALFNAANAGTASLSELTTMLVAVYRTLGFTPD